MERGDIYLITSEHVAGPQHSSVLVVSPLAFNRVTTMPVVVPIIPDIAVERMAGFAISLSDAGTGTTGVIRCDQPQTLDLVARGGRLVERAPPAVVEEVLARLWPLFT